MLYMIISIVLLIIYKQRMSYTRNNSVKRERVRCFPSSENDLNKITKTTIINTLAIATLLPSTVNANNDGLIINIQPPSIFQQDATLTVRNEKHYPQVVKLDLYNAANKNESVAQATISVSAFSSASTKLSPAKGKTISQNLYWYYGRGVGDLTKPIESSGYKIPFSPQESTIICQYPHGKDPAIDFCAKLGTNILAAKKGVVIWTVDEHGDGGSDAKFFSKANLVEIIHEDGSKALYTHLQKGSITVKAGDKVEAGQLIGQIGLSGQTSGPHLHFHVVKLNEHIRDEFIQPVFESDEGNPILIKQGFTIAEGKALPPPQEVQRKNEVQESRKEVALCGQNEGTDNQKALDCLSKGNREDAIKFFISHTKKNPNDALALARLATQYTHLGRHEDAIPAYKNAIQKNWISYDFASLYARSLFATGQREEAIKWNYRSIKLAPDCVGCRQELALQLKEIGRAAEALKLLKEYNESQKAKGKKEYFESTIMLLEDELPKSSTK